MDGVRDQRELARGVIKYFFGALRKSPPTCKEKGPKFTIFSKILVFYMNFFRGYFLKECDPFTPDTEIECDKKRPDSQKKCDGWGVDGGRVGREQFE